MISLDAQNLSGVALQQAAARNAFGVSLVVILGKRLR